jgi:hypothetical protein
MRMLLILAPMLPLVVVRADRSLRVSVKATDNRMICC